ncbi:hypothetical protein [Rhizobium sp. S96]|uniref:hypothetical protein n=1 Tax=Rhizobium sp. S96 TaxID=3055140 RepID=UPI0025AB3A32|nr:hypothetical protein [Rhizobium sp. S96]MDM9621120.1 hypothetical protein [Rhizobium sp. S96]
MITREELYAMVWSEPALAAGRRLGVSSSYLAKVCRALGVPSPPRGYWARKAKGRAPPAPALPAARPGAPTGWSTPGERGAPIKRFYARTPTPSPEGGVHGLVAGAENHFRAGRPVEGTGGYLRPRKRLLVDVTASEGSLERCLDFANRLFMSLERHGHRVVLAAERLERPEIGRRQDPPADGPAPVADVWRSMRPASDPWRPLRPTVAYFGPTPVGLAIVETSEAVLMRYAGQGRFVRTTEDPAACASADAVPYTLTMYREVPSGRLKLVAYSPDPAVSWRREWLETPGERLVGRIGTIVADLERAAIFPASQDPPAG